MREAVSDANAEDIIILSDNDEIPNLNGVNFENSKESIFIFKQKMFYYKLNLFYKELLWTGSKACKKNKLKSPQWLRNIKNKKYPFWRIDTLFSDKKYNNVIFINNGGWHFSNVKTPEEIERKLSNFGHHDEYELSGLNLKKIKEMVSQKKVYYDHFADKSIVNKYHSSYQLKKVDINILPQYLKDNLDKYNDWFDH